MRVLSAEPEKRGLDLSGSAQFRALSSESKDRLLQLLASVGTLESLNLRGLRLKSTNAGGVAELIKCSPRLRTLSVERNALDRANHLGSAEDGSGSLLRRSRCCTEYQALPPRSF